MTIGTALIGAEGGRVAENPPGALCDRELALLVRGHLGDGSLSCGNGHRLTREYQGDHRRHDLTSTSISAALLDSPLPYQGFECARSQARGPRHGCRPSPDVRSSPTSHPDGPGATPGDPPSGPRKEGLVP